MPRSPDQILTQEFLQVRSKILEIAAFYDRLDASSGEADDQRPLQLLRQASAILGDDKPDRAARVQLLFSRQYDDQWRQHFGV